MIEGSSDDEVLNAPLNKEYDDINADGGELFFPSPTTEDLRDLHPSPVHIFRLWQTFIDSINPLIKMFHAPTIQLKILDASADLENVSKGMEALMFGIYAVSIKSFDENECVALFGEESSTLLARYQAGARQALLRAGFLRSSDMTVLQALALYLVSVTEF